ncbi:MAG: acyl-CoA thioesterase [Paracoccaceae bacterium]
MTYTRALRVEFGHCDPAGIVFYPRYFEMMNSVAENFFRDVADYPFERMMAAGHGVPTARVEVDFRAPSRLGEVLDWALTVRRVGRSSVSFAVAAHGGGALRLEGTLVVVWVGAGGRAEAWPEEIAVKLKASEAT